MKRNWRKAMSLLLASAMTMGALAGCGNSKDTNAKVDNDTDGTKSFIDLNVGEDYKDIKADLKVITHRTDLVDTKFKEYITEFQKLYPNINITYEGITSYADDIQTRLTTKDWGDICMIPVTINKDELEDYFISYGDFDTLSKKYAMLDNRSYDGTVYGIPSVANAQGIVYNTDVFDKAGITALPTNPDEFLADLKLISDKTDATPLYTNFAAGWTMTAWDAYLGGSATGSADFMNNTLEHKSNPFSKVGDGANNSGPYAVYYTLYEAVKQKLIEEDPTTTDWEGSKTMIAEGKIGCMVLGSWAVTQMKDAATAAGVDPDKIAYMPFPISIDGKQYASAAPDYCYGINVNSTDDEKIASELYVKWLTEKSGFAASEGSIPIVLGEKYPDVLASFQDITLVEDNPAPTDEAALFNDLNEDSELGINSTPDYKQQIVEAALDGSKTFDQIMDEWNKKWTEAQEANDVEIK